MAQTVPNDKNLNNLQLEFLKSLKYMATEEQLLRHYFARQLDDAIDKAENEKSYTATIYDSWLKTDTSIIKSQSGK